MQHYFHYGFGFKGEVLTESEEELILSAKEGKEGTCFVQLQSYTEDYDGRDWAAVVIQDLGEVPNAGKMLLGSEVLTLINKANLQKSDKEILNALKELGLEHLEQYVEFILFSSHY